MQMTNRPAVNTSVLTEGRHPGYLLKIVEEATPDGWVMKEKSPTMYRWYFALWEVPTLIDKQAPELQTGITSTKFAPKGKFQASRAYTWTCQLLGRHIAPGESVNYDPLYPLPCSVKVEREPGKDYIKILDVEGWADGAQLLTDTLKQSLLTLVMAEEAPTAKTAPPTPPQSPSAPSPGMQSWGNGAPAQSQPPPTTATKPTW